MVETVNIASRLPVSVRLMEPLGNPEKPGLNGVPRYHEIAGKAHPDGAETVTRGVDAGLFKAWCGANENHPWLANDHLRVVSDEEADDLDNPEMMHGWEPGLTALLDDGENTRMAGEGVHVDEHQRGMFNAPDMNAYSNEPYTDSARSAAPGDAPANRVVSPVPQSDGIDDLASGRAKLPSKADAPKVDPKPTDAHDETYRDNFKDHAGQEEPTLRGKSKGEVDSKGTE